MSGYTKNDVIITINEENRKAVVICINTHISSLKILHPNEAKKIGV